MKLSKFFKQFRFAIILTFVLTLSLFGLIAMIIAQESLWFQNSTAELTLKDQELKINFHIDPEEKFAFEEFSRTLGTDSNWTEGISMTINQTTADQIKPYLPQEVKIQASDKSLSFSNRRAQIFSQKLNSALPGQEVEWASASGKLSIHREGSRWRIVINDPAVLIQQATESGQLKLSPGVLEQFWPVLSKFATIRTEIGTDHLKGSFNLK